jgi:hypothetical protein
MGYQAPVFEFSYPSDFNAFAEATYQFVAVKVGTAANTTGAGVGGAALQLPTAGGNILGVLQNNPIIGEAGQVIVEGISQAQLSGATTIGQLLMVDANGKFLPATTGNFAVAQALETGAVGDISTVLIRNFGKQ